MANPEIDEEPDDRADTDPQRLAELYDRALTLEKSGAHAAASRLYREMLAIDPDDRAGVTVRLAAMGHGATPERAPQAYVMTLFDQQAEAFDHILVDQLGYHIPERIVALLDRHAPGPYPRALDLGCGTGLMGAHLDDMARHLSGIDLSGNMVDLAGARAVYDDLYVGDAVSFLQEIDAPPWDLILAADVLPYLGDVRALFASAIRCLGSGGRLVFSTELLDGDGTYRVGASHRFQHGSGYLDAELDLAGFAIAHCAPATIRQEMGVAVAGEIVLADKR